MKLILHLGAGKTGTSSIQYTLQKNADLLEENGVWYLGLMLERANSRLFEWQKQTTVVTDFYQLSQDEAMRQLLEVLRPTIREAEKKHIHTLIWSNESLLGMKYGIVDALKELQREGLEYEIVYYVREYTSWARSAYIQWGIKDKAYTGELKTFKEFSKKRYPSFYRDIEYFLEVVPEAVKVRNMNAVQDVTQDFLKFAKIDYEELIIYRINDAPTNEELFLRAIFNSKFHGKVLPEQFDNALGNDILSTETPEEYLEKFLPDYNDMEEVLVKSSDDRKSLNKLLSEQSQSTLSDDSIGLKEVEISMKKLLMMLAEIAVSQSQKITRLQRVVKDLQKKVEVQIEENS